MTPAACSRSRVSCIDMSRITLRQVEYFRAVARAGSISGAAEAEHVSRSSISAGLDELERILGRVLCVRTKATGIELTPASEQVLVAADDLLARADALERLGRGSAPSGVLTVGCFPSLAPTIMASAWAAMAQHYPEVTLNVVSAPRDEIVEMLLAGKIDCGLAYNLQTFPELETTVLYDTEMHVILSADHPLAAEPVISATDLVDLPLILMDVQPSVDDTMTYFDRCGLRPRILTRTSNFEFIRSLVARGLGYSLFIQRPRNSMSYEGRPIVARPLDPRPHRERTTLAWRSGRKRTEALRAFEEILASGFDRVPASNG